MTIFTERLKEQRKKNNLTQKKLADILGVSQGSYANWENGKREPNFETLLKIALELNTTTSYLLGESNISFGHGSDKFEKLANLPNFHLSEIGLNQIRDLVRAIPYLAEKEGIEPDEYFNIFTKDLPEQTKLFLKAVYFTEILEGNPPFGNNSETTETE